MNKLTSAQKKFLARCEAEMTADHNGKSAPTVAVLIERGLIEVVYTNPFGMNFYRAKVAS
ncbi:hypothetical protein [Aminobacter phage Erebus]|nr:hypothetical protein [Aminobacter phage Erebus]